MGFGFNLFFVFLLIPLTGILFITWLLTKMKLFGKIIGFLWVGIFGLIIFSLAVYWLTSKKVLKEKDYYGNYIIDRNYFHGRQADWQYNRFRFEIKNNDSIYFYETEKEKIIKIYRGTISTTDNYTSERLIINFDQPTHHILTSNPTTYRRVWSFYLVFN